MCFDDSVSSFVSLNFFRGTVLDLLFVLHRWSFSSAMFFPSRFMGLRTLFVTLALLFFLVVVSFLESFVISNLQSWIEPFERLDTVSVINQVDRVRKIFCYWLYLFFPLKLFLVSKKNERILSSHRIPFKFYPTSVWSGKPGHAAISIVENDHQISSVKNHFLSHPLCYLKSS